ncbi:MAG: amidohydrolase family protein [Actinomycetales bacterium]|nr:amidohydrolase family protein [Actinomycetales bacterium]
MIIQAHSAVVAGALVGDTWVEVSDNLIRSVNQGMHSSPDQIIDGTLIPGFIDIHCHGGGGKYFSALSVGEIHSVIQTHRGHGTTSLLASLVSEPIQTLKEQIVRLKPLYKSGQIVGIHLEGPYLSHARCGAHDPKVLVTPDLAEIKELLELADGAIKMITIAPELPGAIEAIKYLSASGITVAIGHSDGGFIDAAAGTNAGASVVTHFMNGMDKSLTEGSFASFVVADERLSVELIIDGHHIPIATAREIYTALGSRIIFITDAMAAAGSIDGTYSIGKLPVVVKEGVARLESNGALAGSTLTMDTVFINAVNSLGLSVKEAVAATSTRAAKRLGFKDRGEIAVGMRADLLSYNSSNSSITLISE